MSLRNTHLCASIALLCLGLSLDAAAQQATNALGLRVDRPLSFGVGGGYGFDYGGRPHVSYKRYLSERDAVEVGVGYRRNRYRPEEPANAWTRRTVEAELSYQRYTGFGSNVAGPLTSLRWYYGGGVGVSRSNLTRQSVFLDIPFETEYRTTAYTIFGLIGLAYQVPRLPLELSLDAGPELEYSREGLNPDSVVGGAEVSSSTYLSSGSLSLGARWTFGGANGNDVGEDGK